MQSRTSKYQNEQERILDHLPDGILTITGNNKNAAIISGFNAAAARMLNINRGDAVGQSLSDVFPRAQPLVQIVAESLAQKHAIVDFNLELDVSDAITTEFLVNTIICKNPDNEDDVIVILKDISGEIDSKRPPDDGFQFEKIVGQTTSMRRVFSLIETVAPTDAAVLINGETGTGKELVARAIHQRSSRSDRLFVPVHCSALTSSLLESDLFGHVKGAFTGAIRDKPGRFEMADGGTVFLDEIATLSQEIQINLLRVLQEKTIERVGDTKTTKVDVRIISATNKSLPELIAQGGFRKDLYYRIKVIQINLPPLRRRKSDIPLLVQHFIERFNHQHGGEIAGVSEEAVRLLKSYNWPGNVRELENAIEHAVIMSKTGKIEPECIPEEIRHDGVATVSTVRHQTVLTTAARIRRALSETGGNVTRAAHKLGMHRTTLWRKMREFDIPRIPEHN